MIGKNVEMPVLFGFYLFDNRNIILMPVLFNGITVLSSRLTFDEVFFSKIMIISLFIRDEFFMKYFYDEILPILIFHNKILICRF